MLSSFLQPMPEVIQAIHRAKRAEEWPCSWFTSLSCFFLHLLSLFLWACLGWAAYQVDRFKEYYNVAPSVFKAKPLQKALYEYFGLLAFSSVASQVAVFPSLQSDIGLGLQSSSNTWGSFPSFSSEPAEGEGEGVRIQTFKFFEREEAEKLHAEAHRVEVGWVWKENYWEWTWEQRCACCSVDENSTSCVGELALTGTSASCRLCPSARTLTTALEWVGRRVQAVLELPSPPASWLLGFTFALGGGNLESLSPPFPRQKVFLLFPSSSPPLDGLKVFVGCKGKKQGALLPRAGDGVALDFSACQGAGVLGVEPPDVDSVRLHTIVLGWLENEEEGGGLQNRDLRKGEVRKSITSE